MVREHKFRGYLGKIQSLTIKYLALSIGLTSVATAVQLNQLKLV